MTKRIQQLKMNIVLMALALVFCVVKADVPNCKDQGPVVNGNPTCTNCQEGYFKNADSTVCSGCSNLCKSCSTSATCDVCMPGAFLSNGRCVQCSAGCTTCSNETTCAVCNDGYSLVGGTCVKCSLGCNKCQDSNTCFSCMDGFSLSNSGTAASCDFVYPSTPLLKTQITIIAIILLVVLFGACAYCMYRFPPATSKEYEAIKAENMRRRQLGYTDNPQAADNNYQGKQYAELVNPPLHAHANPYARPPPTYNHHYDSGAMLQRQQPTVVSLISSPLQQSYPRQGLAFTQVLNGPPSYVEPQPARVAYPNGYQPSSPSYKVNNTGLYQNR